LGDGHLGLAAHARFEAVVVGVLIAGGIDQREGQIADPPHALAPVAGDAGRVVDDGELLAHQPVEQRGFADVWPSNDGDCYCHWPMPIRSGVVIAFLLRAVEPQKRCTLLLTALMAAATATYFARPAGAVRRGCRNQGSRSPGFQPVRGPRAFR